MTDMDMPLPEPDGSAEVNKQPHPGGGYEYDEVDAWSEPLVRAYARAYAAAEVAKEREKSDAMRAALINLRRAYVRLMENGRDRIRMLGGECDPVDKMEQADPALRDAAAAIRARSAKS